MPVYRDRDRLRRLGQDLPDRLAGQGHVVRQHLGQAVDGPPSGRPQIGGGQLGDLLRPGQGGEALLCLSGLLAPLVEELGEAVDGGGVGGAAEGGGEVVDLGLQALELVAQRLLLGGDGVLGRPRGALQLGQELFDEPVFTEGGEERPGEGGVDHVDRPAGVVVAGGLAALVAPAAGVAAPHPDDVHSRPAGGAPEVPDEDPGGDAAAAVLAAPLIGEPLLDPLPQLVLDDLELGLRDPDRVLGGVEDLPLVPALDGPAVPPEHDDAAIGLVLEHGLERPDPPLAAPGGGDAEAVQLAGDAVVAPAFGVPEEHLADPAGLGRVDPALGEGAAALADLVVLVAVEPATGDVAVADAVEGGLAGAGDEGVPFLFGHEPVDGEDQLVDGAVELVLLPRGVGVDAYAGVLERLDQVHLLEHVAGEAVGGLHDDRVDEALVRGLEQAGDLGAVEDGAGDALRDVEDAGLHDAPALVGGEATGVLELALDGGGLSVGGLAGEDAASHG